MVVIAAMTLAALPAGANGGHLLPQPLTEAVRAARREAKASGDAHPKEIAVVQSTLHLRLSPGTVTGLRPQITQE